MAEKRKKVEIILVKHAGFCYGVKRAYQMACDAALQSGVVATLGDLIHNKQVIKTLENQGIQSIKSVSQHPGGRLIIRAHGATIGALEEAKLQGLEIIDATCPHVKIVQDAVTAYHQQGYFIVILGDQGHPEVVGIESRVPKDYFVTVITPDQLPEYVFKKQKIAVVTQTTQSIDRLQDLVAILLKRAKEVVIKNTICNATTIRQEESVALAKTVDCMIIIGGYHSANTRRLRELSEAVCPETHHIEQVSELASSWFEGVSRVGISAGASTPDDLIQAVYERIKQWDV